METNDKGARISLNSIKSLFCDTFKLYQDRFLTLSEIVLLPAFTILLGYAFIFLGFPFTILGTLVIFVGWILFAFSSMALIFSIHNNAGVDTSYRATIKFFWPLVWIAILSFFAFIGASIMLIIPGIWLAIVMTLRNYTLVLENRKGMDALRQSKDYVKGYWWAVFGRTILVVILAAILSMIIHVPFNIIGGKTMEAIASLVLVFFLVPFASIFYYKIYENLRTLKPELQEAQHSGGGFIKVSAIVGLVAIAFLIVGGAVALAYYGSRLRDNGGAYDVNANNNFGYPASNQ